jgi:hypothetical protein
MRVRKAAGGLDSDATGDWLPVQRGGTVGWMLVDALQPPD